MALREVKPLARVTQGMAGSVGMPLQPADSHTATLAELTPHLPCTEHQTRPCLGAALVLGEEGESGKGGLRDRGGTHGRRVCLCWGPADS